MGKIITRGYASREVEYDHMEITMKFRAREHDTKTAIRKITEDCETFLVKMKKAGVDISKLEAGSNSVEKEGYGEKRYVDAHRSLTIEIPYDLVILDSIMKMAETDSLSVDIDIDYSYSSKEETYNQLLEEASANARKKADLMAAATGTTVAGVERIKVERNNDYIFDDDEDDDIDYGHGVAYGAFCACEESRGLYTELKPQTTTESAEVYIEWILE